MDAIIYVFELPPKLSLNRNVSLLSLYGMNFFGFSDRVFITNPKTVRDLLILAASFRRSPVVEVYFYRSLPAKSTKLSLLLRRLCSTTNVNMEWLLELSKFI